MDACLGAELLVRHLGCRAPAVRSPPARLRRHGAAAPGSPARARLFACVAPRLCSRGTLRKPCRSGGRLALSLCGLCPASSTPRPIPEEGERNREPPAPGSASQGKDVSSEKAIFWQLGENRARTWAQLVSRQCHSLEVQSAKASFPVGCFPEHGGETGRGAGVARHRSPGASRIVPCCSQTPSTHLHRQSASPALCVPGTR